MKLNIIVSTHKILNMKNIGNIIIVLLCLISSNIIAQNMEVDAINFGTDDNIGTARYIAVGGAMSAVGGDITNIKYNPAGIGIYKSSVLVFTPSYEINKTDAVFNMSSIQRMNSKFYVSNIGAVFSMPNEKFGLIRTFNFALAYNSSNSFNSKNVFQLNTTNSITNNWVNEAKEVHENEELEFSYDIFSFETVGAYNTWLVNFDTATNTYSSPISNSILQKRVFESKGNKGDFAIALGMNLLDKLYLGGSLSLPSINYTSTTKFTEEDKNNINSNFEKFELAQNIKTSGYGVNAKIGAIFKPISTIRLSASIETKTRYTLEEEYTSDFITTFDTAVFESKSPQGKFEYDLSTPWKANAGIAFIHKKVGFISFDYEIVDYSSTRFHLEEDYSDLQNSLNNSIKNKYQVAHNLKLGAEFKYKQLRLRGGYAMRTSPLKSSFRENDFDFSKQQFSGGIGFLWKKVSLDASYRYTLNKEYEMSFDGINGIYKTNDNQLMSLSFAYKISK